MDWVSLGANWMEQLAALITLFHCAYVTLLYIYAHCTMKIEIVSEYQSVGFSQLAGLWACWTLSFLSLALRGDYLYHIP